MANENYPAIAMCCCKSKTTDGHIEVLRLLKDNKIRMHLTENYLDFWLVEKKSETAIQIVDSKEKKLISYSFGNNQEQTIL